MRLLVTFRKLKIQVSMLLAIALLLPQAWMAPTAAAAIGDIVMSADYDTAGDTNGWISRGTTVVEQTYGTWQGSAESGGSLLATGRTANWHGPSIALTNVQKGAKYEFSLYAKMLDHDGAIKMTLQQNGLPANGDGSSNPEMYKTVAGANGTTTDWVHLTGELTLNPDATGCLLYVEADDIAVDNATVRPSFYIDTFTLKLVEEAPDASIITEGFEEGIGDWVRRFAEAPNDGIEVTGDEKYSGEQSLKTTVAAQYDGPLLSVVGKMQLNHIYRLSAWVKMAEGEEPASLRITVQNGSDGYSNIGQTVTINDQQWIQLTGEYTQSVTPGETLNAYVEIANVLSGTTRTFLVDDFKLEYVGQAAAPLPVQEDIPQLMEHFKDDFLLGNAVSSQDLVGERLKLLKRHHNVVTAENAMKPEQLYNASKEFTPAGTDALVQKILDEGLLLVGHTLVWHAQSPTWLNTAEDGTPLSREEALANLRTHITQVVEHYGNLAGDKLISWDVVNEAMSDNPPNPADWKASLRNSPWKAAIGDDYVEQAFRITREVMDENGWEDVVLYYNDYNDENPNKSTAIYNMIKEINEKYAAEAGNEGKLLIGGMGLQSHYNTNTSFSLIEAALAKYISLGVEISITELDIMAGSNNVQTDAEVKAQAYLYAQLFKLYQDNAEHIARVTFWGLNDGNSWRRENSPLIFDRQLQAKPGYYAILDPDTYMEENPPVVIEAKQAEAQYGTPTVDGTVDSVWSNAAELDVNHYLQAWQGATGKAKALWDDSNLYVLVEVTDEQLDKGSANPWEQDSIEIFLDQNNGKTSAYEDNDGQYRVNYENTTSFNPGSIAEGFESATSVSGTNYTVEVKIPLNKATPANDVKLGFDVQVNDGKDGARQSTATWSATNGNGYQDTSVFGVLTLKGKAEEMDQSGIAEGFEEGFGDWVRRFAAEPNDGIEVTADEKYSGEQSLKTTVAAQYDGPLLSVVGKMHENHRYRLSAWVKMAEGEPSARLRITVQNGSDGYTNIGQTVSVNDQQWVQLTGEYTQSVTPGEILNAYVEIADALSGTTRTFLVDDFKLEYVGPVAPPQPIQEDIPQLMEHFKDNFLLGNAVSSQDLVGERLKLLKRHHNVVTAENAMKPEQLYNASKEFTPAGTDALVQKILDEGLLLVGHTLVWHAQSPTWLNTAEDGTPLSREEALANLRTHITQVVEHYGNLAGDKLISWDVVNEAMSDNPPNPADWKASLRNSPWKAAIGDDYVEQAFRITREVMDENGWEDVVLYYNDYNDENPNKSTAIYNMIKEINEKYAAEAGNEGKLLIGGMGLQSHYNTNTSFSLIEAALAKYISLGVEISITELDIMAGSNNVQTDAEVKAQAYLYAQLFKLYQDNAEHIARVTFWGLNDGNSWRRENSPLIFDRQLQAKPGYYAILDPDTYMEENPPVVIEAKQAEAQYGTPTVDGTVDSVWSNAAELDVNHYLQAWQGATGKAKALWDDSNLYVLVEVTDEQLDKGSANPWEQDSIEIFLDQNNGKTSAYEDNDGQYRVNYENTTSFNPGSIAEGFESATSVSGTNYTVEVKIPLNKATPANDVKLGFDVQVNDGKDGARQSTATWSATNGNGYQDTSVFGVLTLKGKQSSNPGTNDPGTSNPGTVYVPVAPTTPTDGPVKLDVPTQAVEGRAVAAVSDAKLSDALAKAKANEDGKKEVIVELQKVAGTNGYGVQLGAAALKGSEKYSILVKSELGTIQLPNDMLSGTDVTGDVMLTIGAADLSGVSEAIRSQIGDRPVIELQMQAGGKAIDWNNPNAPVTVSIPYEPTAEELANPNAIVIWYVDGNGNASAVPNGRYDAAASAVVFKTTHFSTYAVVSVPRSFDDIGSLAWAKDAIEALASREVVNGVSETAYQPSADVKRADFLVLLVRALGLQAEGQATFADVAETAYYYEAVSAAEALGITKGDGKGNFNPNAAITRQEMFVLTARALEAAGQAVEAAGTLTGYSDAAAVAAYAQDNTAALIAAGIVKGIDGEIQPDGIVTRAQAAVIVYRALGLGQ